MRTLPVRLLDLATALEDHDRESTTYYFDAQSGEIVFLTEDGRGSDKRWDIISNNRDRFIDIEPMNSPQRHKIRHDFVATLPPSPLQEKLKWSLENTKPFRRFQDTVAEDKPLRKQWFEFHHEAMQKIALDWLAAHHIEPIAPGSPAAPSLLDQEAEALAANQEEGDYDDHEEELNDDSHETFEELDEDDEGEPVDFLSEQEEALLTEFVESLPQANFNLAKLHGLCSAFAAGPVTMTSTDLLGVLSGFARAGSVDLADSAFMLDLLGRFYGGIIEALEFESFEPQLEQTGVMLTEPSAAIISWCNGFALGIDHYKRAWESWFKDVRRAQAISLILGTSEPGVLRQPGKAIEEDIAWEMIVRISELVPLIYTYWAFESAFAAYLDEGE
jgi:yecA family protein